MQHTRALPPGANAVLFHLTGACLFAAPLAFWSGFVDWALGPKRFGMLSAQVPPTLTVGLGLLTITPCLLVALLRRHYGSAARLEDGRLRLDLLFHKEPVIVDPVHVSAVWATGPGVRLTTHDQTWLDRLTSPLLIPAADDAALAEALRWAEVEQPQPPPAAPVPLLGWAALLLLILTPLWSSLGPVAAFKLMFVETGVAVPNLTEFLLVWGAPWACAVLLFPVALWARARSPQLALRGLLLAVLAYAVLSMTLLFIPLVSMPDKL